MCTEQKSVNSVMANALSHLVFLGLNTIETCFKLFSVRLTKAATVRTCDAYLLTVAITTTVTKGNGTIIYIITKTMTAKRKE